VAAGANNSTAIGTGATASLSNQMVFGTASTTYTASGINSDLSRDRQSGRLGIVTSDNFGNLASDNGALYKEVSRVKSAAAVSMALADPILADTQHFAVKLNWGGFDGANAVGVTASGLLRRDLITKGDQLTLSGGVGYGESSVTGNSESTVGGHAGAQLAW
jgi:trimeric autotransporter adhesin